MTIEEMDAEIARMKANLQRWCEDDVAELTEELAAEKNPYWREIISKELEEAHAIRNKRYD